MVFEKIRKNLSGRPIKNLQRWGEENIRDFGIRGDFGNSRGYEAFALAYEAKTNKKKSS